MPRMTNILTDIEVRAKRLHIPMYRLCALAGVHATMFSKWKAGVDPRMSSISKLTEKLDELEGENV